MNEADKSLVYGIVMGALITFILIGQYLKTERNDCQEVNNVYKCERVYIPTVK